MPFVKGQSGNPSGRIDRRKTRAQIAITKLVDENSEKLGQWLDEIYSAEGAKAAFTTFTSVVEYALPKLARQELTGEGGGPVETVTSFKLADLE